MGFQSDKFKGPRAARTPTNQTLCFRYSGTNAYLTQKSSVLIAVTFSRDFCYCLLLGHPHETSVKPTNISGKQVRFAPVETVIRIFQAFEFRASSQNSKQKKSTVTTHGLAQIFHSVLKMNTPHGTKQWQQSPRRMSVTFDVWENVFKV